MHCGIPVSNDFQTDARTLPEIDERGKDREKEREKEREWQRVSNTIVVHSTQHTYKAHTQTDRHTHRHPHHPHHPHLMVPESWRAREGSVSYNGSPQFNPLTHLMIPESWRALEGVCQGTPPSTHCY